MSDSLAEELSDDPVLMNILLLWFLEADWQERLPGVKIHLFEC